MTPSQSDRYLRLRAQRVIDAPADDYPAVARQLASGVLELLDARENGRHLTDDRIDVELAEIRDEVLAVSNAASHAVEQLRAWIADELARFAAATVAMPTYRKSIARLDRGVAEVQLSHTLLDQRVNALAERIERTDP